MTRPTDRTGVPADAADRLADRLADVAVLLDAMGEACLLCDFGGRVAHANAALERLLAEDREGGRVRREMEAFARIRLSGLPRPDAIAPAIAPSEREIRTAARSYRVRCRLAAEGLLGGRGALLLVLEPLDGVPPCDGDLARRYGLTRREITIARLVGDGRTNQEIADVLGISLYTARNHTARVLDKLDAPNRASVAARLAGRPAKRRAGAA